MKLKLARYLRIPVDDNGNADAGTGTSGTAGNGDAAAGQAGAGGDGKAGDAGAAGASGAASTALAAGGAGDGGKGSAGEAGAAGKPAAGAAGAPGAVGADGKPAAAAGDGKPAAVAEPADWREQMAGGDTKRLEELKRFGSLKALGDAYISAQLKIRSGSLKAALPDKPTDVELAEWRKQNGIPETPEKYELKLKDGLVIGDNDKPIVDGFLKSAHAANMTPAQASEAVQWYHQEQARQTQERHSLDAQQTQETLDALNIEWGRDFRPNMGKVGAVMDRFFTPEEKAALASARMPDGRAVFNSPGIIRSFVQIAGDMGISGVVTGPGADGQMKAVGDRLAEIEGWMSKPRGSAEGKKYWGDEKVQGEYRQLLDQKARMQERKAA